MCMKNRFGTFCRHASRALGAMAFLGLVWSCTDDYVLDDEKPEWLSKSIYSYLEERGSFQNFLKLVADPDINSVNDRPLTEELSRTGSKTLFVANDDAWNAFFQKNATLPKTNPWHTATSFENLSKSQKKLLIHSSMLNNAIVMENLASEEGSGSGSPQRGMYMRRYTDFMLTDTVAYLAPEDVPYSYNDDDMGYWKRFRPEGKTPGIYLVKDSTLNMMLTFTQEHMSNQSILNEDFAKFMGRERSTDDVHIYDARLIEKDQVCENGYVNLTEKVLAPLPNMAEAIRTNGRTYIFSHMLDRFSYPYYNDYVTKLYNTQNPSFTDSIFTMKYFAQLGPGRKSQTTGPDGRKVQDSKGVYALKFDPGWNEFYDEKDVHEDMAAMFIPNDETLWTYFSKGEAGYQLIQAYSTHPDFTKGDFEALYRQIDDIPLSTLQALINVMMFRSFTSSVPSKMTTLRNDANEEMFAPEDAQLVRDGGHIDTCFLACNGAVFIMDKVYGPADYTSVAAPAYISPESHPNNIMKWAIYQGSDSKETDKMHLNYFAYLKAMKSRFTFFLPSDEALTRYYDPISFTSQHARVINMQYTGTGALPMKTGRILYPYDTTTGEIGETAYRTDQLEENELINRLKDILESHTIVMEDETPITQQVNDYYLTKNGAAVKLTREGSTITKVQGGFQLENERLNASGIGSIPDQQGLLHVNITADNTHDMTRDGNGMTYVLDDSPIIPASKSVYGIINDGSNPSYAAGEYAAECQDFFELTNTSAYEDIIKACGLDATKFRVWESDGGVDLNVKFFSNFNYTVLVPTNEAIQDAVSKGLPTWTSISDDYTNIPTYEARCTLDAETNKYYFINDDDNKTKVYVDKYDELTENPCLYHSDSLRLQTQITYLNNFIRCHFADNSVFADKSELAEKQYVTSSYDIENGTFVRINMSRTGSSDGSLYVRDSQGGSTISVIADPTQGPRNIMARDMVCIQESKSTAGTYKGPKTSPTGMKTLNYLVLMSSSFSVIHQIEGVLNHTALVGGRYDSTWATPSACKQYLKRFAITDKKTR